jgi:hypothetical protein
MLAASPAQASFLSGCLDSMTALLSGARAKDPFFEAGHAAGEGLRSVVALNQAEFGEISFTDDLMWFLATQRFQDEQMESLLKFDDRWISGDELHRRLVGMGASLRAYSFEDKIVTEYERSSPEAFLKKFRAAQAWDASKKQTLFNELKRRQALAQVDTFFENPVHYPVVVQGDRVRFPDGVSRRIVGKTKDGDLVIGVPFDHVVRTQDYVSGEIVGQYAADPALKKMIFQGEFLPDGRVLILDQHHRTLAYSRVVSPEIPFVLRANPAAAANASIPRYSTESHLRLLKFRSQWEGVSSEERIALMRHVEEVLSGPGTNAEKNDRVLEGVRGLYYGLSHFPRPRPE